MKVEDLSCRKKTQHSQIIHIYMPKKQKVQDQKEMATHSSTLVCKIPWTEEPGGLQSVGSQRVGHD